MVGCRLKDGVQVNGINAQVKQLVEALDDPAQIAALVTPDRRWGTPFLEVGRVIGRIAISKAVRKNLIENRILHPIWDSHEYLDVIRLW